MNVSLKYLFLRENVLSMVIVQNNFGYVMMFTQNIFVYRSKCLTIVIRVRLDFHCRVIFLCVGA